MPGSQTLLEERCMADEQNQTVTIDGIDYNVNDLSYNAIFSENCSKQPLPNLRSRYFQARNEAPR